MTKIKLCGLSRPEDILCANELMPDLVGFVFWKKSRRYVDENLARELKTMLDPAIKAVGVFVDEDVNKVAHLIGEGIIDMAQLHGSEDDDYISQLRKSISATCLNNVSDRNTSIRNEQDTGDIRVIKAYKIRSEEDVRAAEAAPADMILTDAGMGEGRAFDWELLRNIKRPYFLAGGLDRENVEDAIRTLSPYGVDVSSGIETDGRKDHAKMREFVARVREQS